MRSEAGPSGESGSPHPAPLPAGEGLNLTQSFIPTQRDPTAAPDTEPWLRRAMFGLVVAIYVLAFPYHPALRSPNELCRLWQTRALVDFHTLDLNQAIMTWGYVGDLSRMDGKLYPSKAPLLSFADVPIYRALEAWYGNAPYAVPELALVFWSRLALTVLPTLLMLILVRRFLRTYLTPRIADGLTAAYALGTLALSYSLLFMSHQTTAVLVFASFYCVWRVLRGDWTGGRRLGGIVLGGALAGATVAAEYTGALPVIAVYVWAAIAVLTDRSPRSRAARNVPAPPAGATSSDAASSASTAATSPAAASIPSRIARLLGYAVLTVAGALPFVLFLMWYHSACFGGPFESGYKHLNDAGYQPWHMGGFLGIRYPDPRAFVLSYFSPLRGLFTLSPFLIFGPIGTVLMHRRIKEAKREETPGPFAPAGDRALPWLVWILLLGYTYFTSSFAYDSWGWTTGPRHLTPLVPFLLLPVGLVIDAATRRGSSALSGIVSGIAAALAAGAVLVTGALSLVNYIPDSLSNALFALALPLFEAGYLPPSLLGTFIPNPWSGAVLVVLLVAAAMLIFAALVPRAPKQLRPSATATIAGLVVLVCYFAALASSTRHDSADAGAYNHLHGAWLQPPGTTFSLGATPR